MDSHMINIKTLCIIILVLVMVFTDNILHNFPILINLFTDTTNYILLMLLIIFTMLINLECGIILGIIVIYISIYIDYQKITIISNSTKINTPNIILNNSNTIPTTTDHKIFNNVVNNNVVNNNLSEHKVTFSEAETIINDSKQYNNNHDEILSDSEFIYNNTSKPFPNNNIKPFQPNIESFVSLNNYNDNDNITTQTLHKECVNDLITNVGEPDRSGFDISGCRYDMKNSPQNLTKYGPPLAQCSIYDSNKIKECGTAFYPLNA